MILTFALFIMVQFSTAYECATIAGLIAAEHYMTICGE